MKAKLLIFDWDGTLSDSAPKIIDCVQKAAVCAGVPVLEDDVIRNIIGLGLPEVMEVLYPECDQARRDKIREFYVEHFLASDQVPSPFFNGVMQGLEQLRDMGFMMTVATGKSRRGLNRVLQNLQMETFFHSSRCADETASKPHPKMLQELLEEFDVTPEQAIMVGDTEYDMSMAQQLGVPRVAVSYGAHQVERLVKYQPCLVIDSFSEFVNWVNMTRKELGESGCGMV